MPEYLAPGVYVEETSFRPKTIEGVSTSTAGFVGPARYGPTDGEPELLTSFADYERLFGGLEPLSFGGSEQPNFLAHAVRAFFEEGGKRCYVARVYEGTGGRAGHTEGSLTLTARFPGEAGDMRITFTPRFSDNLLVSDPITGAPQVRRVRARDLVFFHTPGSDPPDGEFMNVAQAGNTLEFVDSDGATRAITSLDPENEAVLLVTVDVGIERPISSPLRPGQRFEAPDVLEGFSLHPDDQQSLAAYFNATPDSRRLALYVPFSITLAASPPSSITGMDYAVALFGADPDLEEYTPRTHTLSGGSDGALPAADTYLGDDTATTKTGLRALEDLEDISIVAAPGYSYNYSSNEARAETIQAHLINHATRMRYRIAVLDAPDGQTVGEARNFRGKIDSKYAALYYPWVTVLDPVTRKELNLPPSGFIAGIYARNDIERGVQKAPANEVVRLAIGFETMLNKAQQEVLNPEGVNCFRFFEGRGYRLWGARLVSSDQEFKYVNIRRYLAYLERSIDKGTQVFVFESNSEQLWDNVRRTVEDFLLNEWKSGRLMGLTPEEAYFVRCDRSTMTQNDIDNGRMICLIGVALLRPAEFVIFRIGQKLLERTG